MVQSGSPTELIKNRADDKLDKRICGEVGFGKRRQDQMTVDTQNWLFTPGSSRVTYPALHSILTLCHIYCLFIGPHLHRMLDRQFYGELKIRRLPALALQFISPIFWSINVKLINSFKSSGSITQLTTRSRNPKRWVINQQESGGVVFIFGSLAGVIFAQYWEFTADLLTRNLLFNWEELPLCSPPASWEASHLVRPENGIGNNFKPSEIY